MRGRFVGREREVARLREILGMVAAGDGPTAAVVLGVPGAGKSRLLAEIVGRSQLPIFRITGYEPEQHVPLTAARDLLRMATRAPREGPRLEAIAFGRQAAGRGASPLRLFELAYRCVVESSPTLVAVDDLQWVDEVSGALLNYLLRAAAADGGALATIAMGRTGARAGAARDAFASILDASRLAEIELEPLQESAGVALVRALAPAADHVQARRIWERAAGSPFWIHALVGTSDPREAGLERRFSRLSSDGAAMLRAIAVMGRPAGATDLAAALDWPAPRASAAIAELVARGLAVEGPEAVEAAHDLIREAARRELPEAAARTIHARLARHLRAAAGDEVQLLREALDHAQAGGEPPIPIALAIARAPQRRLMGAAGLGALVEIADQAGRNEPGRGELVVALAELATELGDRTLEMERWVAVAEQASGLPRARALHAAAKAAYRLGLREAAAGFIARARSAGTADRALGIALDAQESEILRWLAHRLPEARRLTTRAVAAAEEAIVAATERGQPIEPRLRAATIEALHAAYDLALQEGDEHEQVDVVERLLDLVEGELDEIEARLLLATAYRRSGMVLEAERTAREMREQATRRLYPAVTVTAGHHLARALYALGRLEEAETVAAEADELSARIGETGRFLSEIRSLRPGIKVSRGDWTAGIDQLRADIEREPDPHYRLGIHQEIATWLSRLAGPGAAAEVRERIATARECLDAVGCPRCGRELTLRSAEALARVGDVDAARSLIASMATRARKSYEGRLYLVQAIAACRMMAGSPTRAAATLARLHRRLDAGGYRREALWADLDRAAVLSAFDRPAAVALYRSIVDRAEAGGVLTDLHLARRRLRELGARTSPPRRQVGPLGLSRRELEVARLAATGASNPEIAATLFLSRKTVERHVSAALEKAGARNRTELATRLAAIAESAPSPK